MFHSNPRDVHEQSSLNGDGFGLGWYTDDRKIDGSESKTASQLDACVFTSLKPAWSDRNLHIIAEKTKSNLIFAHVRAAAPGSGLSTELSCHPFRFGKFLFMHNGFIADFERIRRKLLAPLGEIAFNFAISNSCIDSVTLFALFINQLDKGPYAFYSPEELREKLERTIGFVAQVCSQSNVRSLSLLNVVVSDGSCILATRYSLVPYQTATQAADSFQRRRKAAVEQFTINKNNNNSTVDINKSPRKIQNPSISEHIYRTMGLPPLPQSSSPPSSIPMSPITPACPSTEANPSGLNDSQAEILELDEASVTATLYFATGTRWSRERNCLATNSSSANCKAGTDLSKSDFRMSHSERSVEVAIVTSEPLTEHLEDWLPVPLQTMVVISPKIDVSFCAIPSLQEWNSPSQPLITFSDIPLLVCPLPSKETIIFSHTQLNSNKRMISFPFDKKSTPSPLLFALTLPPGANPYHNYLLQAYYSYTLNLNAIPTSPMISAPAVVNLPAPQISKLMSLFNALSLSNVQLRSPVSRSLVAKKATISSVSMSRLQRLIASRLHETSSPFLQNNEASIDNLLLPQDDKSSPFLTKVKDGNSAGLLADQINFPTTGLNNNTTNALLYEDSEDEDTDQNNSSPFITNNMNSSNISNINFSRNRNLNLVIEGTASSKGPGVAFITHDNNNNNNNSFQPGTTLMNTNTTLNRLRTIQGNGDSSANKFKNAMLSPTIPKHNSIDSHDFNPHNHNPYSKSTDSLLDHSFNNCTTNNNPSDNNNRSILNKTLSESERSAVLCSVFLHDLNILITGSQDGSIAFWDVNTRCRISHLRGHASLASVLSLAAYRGRFKPSGCSNSMENSATDANNTFGNGNDNINSIDKNILNAHIFDCDQNRQVNGHQYFHGQKKNRNGKNHASKFHSSRNVQEKNSSIYDNIQRHKFQAKNLERNTAILNPLQASRSHSKNITAHAHHQDCCFHIINNKDNNNIATNNNKNENCRKHKILKNILSFNESTDISKGVHKVQQNTKNPALISSNSDFNNTDNSHTVNMNNNNNETVEENINGGVRFSGSHDSFNSSLNTSLHATTIDINHDSNINNINIGTHKDTGNVHIDSIDKPFFHRPQGVDDDDCATLLDDDAQDKDYLYGIAQENNNLDCQCCCHIVLPTDETLTSKDDIENDNSSDISDLSESEDDDGEEHLLVFSGGADNTITIWSCNALLRRNQHKKQQFADLNTNANNMNSSANVANDDATTTFSTYTLSNNNSNINPATINSNISNNNTNAHPSPITCQACALEDAAGPFVLLRLQVLPQQGDILSLLVTSSTKLDKKRFSESTSATVNNSDVRKEVRRGPMLVAGLQSTSLLVMCLDGLLQIAYSIRSVPVRDPIEAIKAESAALYDELDGLHFDNQIMVLCAMKKLCLKHCCLLAKARNSIGDSLADDANQWWRLINSKHLDVKIPPPISKAHSSSALVMNSRPSLGDQSLPNLFLAQQSLLFTSDSPFELETLARNREEDLALLFAFLSGSLETNNNNLNIDTTNISDGTSHVHEGFDPLIWSHLAVVALSERPIGSEGDLPFAAVIVSTASQSGVHRAVLAHPAFNPFERYFNPSWNMHHQQQHQATASVTNGHESEFAVLPDHHLMNCDIHNNLDAQSVYSSYFALQNNNSSNNNIASAPPVAVHNNNINEQSFNTNNNTSGLRTIPSLSQINISQSVASLSNLQKNASSSNNNNNNTNNNNSSNTAATTTAGNGTATIPTSSSSSNFAACANTISSNISALNQNNSIINNNYGYDIISTAVPMSIPKPCSTPPVAHRLLSSINNNNNNNSNSNTNNTNIPPLLSRQSEIVEAPILNPFFTSNSIAAHFGVPSTTVLTSPNRSGFVPLTSDHPHASSFLPQHSHTNPTFHNVKDIHRTSEDNASVPPQVAPRISSHTHLFSPHNNNSNTSSPPQLHNNSGNTATNNNSKTQISHSCNNKNNNNVASIKIKSIVSALPALRNESATRDIPGSDIAARFFGRTAASLVHLSTGSVDIRHPRLALTSFYCLLRGGLCGARQRSSVDVVAGNNIVSTAQQHPAGAQNVTVAVGSANFRHKSFVECLTVAGNELISGAADGTIIVWSLTSLKSFATLEGHTSGVLTMVSKYYSSNSLFASFVAQGTLRGGFKSSDGLPMGVDFELVVNNNNRNKSDEESSIGSDMSTNNNPATVPSSDEDGCFVLFSGSRDGSIRVWDLKTKICISTLRSHTGEVLCLRISSCGDFLFSASSTGELFAWDVSSKISLVGVMSMTHALQAHGNKYSSSKGVNNKINQNNINSKLNSANEIEANFPFMLQHSPTTSTVINNSNVNNNDNSKFISPYLSNNNHSNNINNASNLDIMSCFPSLSPSVSRLLTIPSIEIVSIQRNLVYGASVLSPGNTHCELYVSCGDGITRLVTFRFTSSPSLAPTTIPAHKTTNSMATVAAGADLTSIKLNSTTSGFSNFDPQKLSSLKGNNINSDGKDEVAIIDPSSPFCSTELESILAKFVAIPSVSSNQDSSYIWAAAQFLAFHLESIGAEVKIARTSNSPSSNNNGSHDCKITQQHSHTHNNNNNNNNSQSTSLPPVVLGRLGNNPKVPTVVFYGHYDVVPAVCTTSSESNPWGTDPWRLTSIDGFMYGRGVSDNKGPIVSSILAAKSFALLKENLPVNIVWVIEGAEEIGSPGFESCVETYKQLGWFSNTVAIIACNSYWATDTRPCVVYGMRGVLDLQVVVQGGHSDLHSGVHGGAIVDALQDVVAIASSLTDPSGFVCVPGFYDKVKPIQPDEKRRLQIAANAMGSIQQYSSDVGCASLRSNRFDELIAQRWCDPCLTISEVWTSSQRSGGFKSGSIFRVLSGSAGLNISIRFVANQSADELFHLVSQHLQHEFKKRRSPNTLSIRKVADGKYWHGDLLARVFRDAVSSVSETWESLPLLIREGGSMPVMSFLETSLNAPAVQIPIGQASDSAHLPNERIRLVNLQRGVLMLRNLFKKLGSHPLPQQQQQQQQPMASQF